VCGKNAAKLSKNWEEVWKQFMSKLTQTKSCFILGGSFSPEGLNFLNDQVVLKPE
jgi:hypothetical protein